MALCTVYRSVRKADTYLYLAESMDFEDLPEPLRQAFGEPAHVMFLDLTPGRRLAHADPAEVLRALQDPGYYLQLPPKLSIEEEITRGLS